MKRVFTLATDKLDGLIIGTMRMVVGVLWLANLEWKRPPDFGLAQQNGLYKYVDSAVRLPVFGPYAWFVENVVLKQYRLFGWITLLLESAVAIMLILGYKTRLAALVGAGLTVPIFLSVLNYDKAYEWPWSYYLMFAIHLLLFATAAGYHLGLDGVLKAGDKARGRAISALGLAAVALGVVGLIAARGIDFAARTGAQFGWSNGELKVAWFNPFSALLTIILGAVAIGGAFTGKRLLVMISAGVFALMTLEVVLRWRNGTGSMLGGTGANIALWGLFAVGLFVCARPGRQDVPDAA